MGTPPQDFNESLKVLADVFEFECALKYVQQLEGVVGEFFKDCLGFRLRQSWHRLDNSLCCALMRKQVLRVLDDCFKVLVIELFGIAFESLLVQGVIVGAK